MMSRSSRAGSPVLSENSDPPPFVQFNADGGAPCLIVCDHASNVIPAALAQLGLSEDHLREHMAWDIGAQAVAQELANGLNAPAILASYSRLVIDCNRYTHDPDSILSVSDGIVVPGNSELGETDRTARISDVWRPYHAAIETAIQRFADAAISPVVISVHTMTPQMRGQPRRKQEFTVCWTQDDRIARIVLERLDARRSLVVGDNEPYGLDLGIDYTIPEHAMRRGLAHFQFEIRQDLVQSPADARSWAELITECVKDLVEDDKLRTPRERWR